jgi:hypothetical protein
MLAGWNTLITKTTVKLSEEEEKEEEVGAEPRCTHQIVLLTGTNDKFVQDSRYMHSDGSL